jgi:hypothetical protein
VGAYLRFTNLDFHPLWIDEALLGCGYLVRQEFIGGLLAVHDDYWFRFPYALAGTLTIGAIYLVMKNKGFAIYAAWAVAVFPLFVFWSRLARPYALAGLCVVLAWRWRWVMVAAILQTPMAIIGLRWAKHPATFILIGFAVAVVAIRPDTEKISLDFLLTNPRLWYVPLLAGLLWCGDYVLPRLIIRSSDRAPR